MFAKLVLTTAALVVGVSAQSSEWGQCGGIEYAGPIVCPSGWVCTVLNEYFSQCLQGTTTSPPVTVTPPPTSPPTTTSGGAPSGTATAGPLGPTLLTGNLWIRAVEEPNFHKYLQSADSGQPGPAVLGSYTTAAQFQLTDGQLVQQLPGGDKLYLTVDTTSAGSSTYLSTSFSTTPGTVGTFAWQGDGLTWTAPGIARQNIGAWLACGDTTVPGAFINLGAYAYLTPAGCADETLNYYNGATAVS